MRPAQRGAGALDFLGAKRAAVAAAGAGLGGRALADGGLRRDQAGARIGLRFGQRCIDLAEIMPVAGHHMPAGGAEAGRHVLAAGQAHRAIDGNGVVVPDHVQPAQLQVAGQRNRLLADTLHQAAIAGNHPGAVIHQAIPEHTVQVPLGHGHAHRHRQPLPQRPCGAFNARQLGVLGVAGARGMPLAEAPDVIQRRLLIAGQVQQRIDQHGAMACRQHEPVSIRPARGLGIEHQVVGKQHGGNIGHAHRHAGVAAVGRLHSVHGKRPDGIGGAGHIRGHDRS